MEIKNILICGAGTMGNGIAHVFALNGFNVSVLELNSEISKKALNTISLNLDRQIKKNIINQDQKTSTLNNLSFITNIDEVQNDTDLVIEAIYENYEAKKLLFQQLDKKIKKDSIFASNTSAISITNLSKNIRPDRFLGMHFMNPVPVMKLVEIVRGYSTSDLTFNTIFNMAKSIDKIPVSVNDYPGFISNRILLPMINEAIYALYENVASVEDIDAVMKLGMNHPMGPLQLADFIGLDVCLDIMNVLYEGFSDSKYRPCPLLKKMVAAGKLGRKSGEGFYKY